jgi:hypothetical protein
VVYATRIPSKKTDVIVIANNPQLNGHIEDITNYLLNVKQGKSNFNQLYASKPVEVDNKDLEKFSGRYLVKNAGSHSSHLKHIRYYDIKFEGTQLNFYFSKKDFVSLIPIGDGLFKDPDYPAIFKFFQPYPDSAMQIEAIEQPGVVEEMNRVDVVGSVTSPSKEYLQSYTGKYYSKHLDYYFTIILNEKNELVLKRPTIADKQLEPYAENQFIFHLEDGMGSGWNVLMKFTFDNNLITGFDLQHIRLMHHRFEKVE